MATSYSNVLKILELFQVGDENYTAELLYAGDKYELDGLVNIFTFAVQFSQTG